MTIVGFSGTRNGMTPEQLKGVAAVLLKYRPSLVVHGDCKGADVEFHALAIQARVEQVELYPGCDKAGRSPLRARCDLLELPSPVGRQVVPCVVHPPEPYLKRNDQIARRVNVLIAAPSTCVEQKRGSGTWSTIRAAQRRGKIVYIACPDGTVRTLPRVPDVMEE